jgi:hypothetical protein
LPQIMESGIGAETAGLSVSKGISLTHPADLMKHQRSLHHYQLLLPLLHLILIQQ